MQSTISKVDKQDFDPERSYKVSILVFILTGMDCITPLLEYVHTTELQVPDVESCKCQKNLIIRYRIKDEWRQLLGFTDWESEGGYCSVQVLESHAHAAFQAMDRNGDGYIDKVECQDYLNEKGASGGLLANMMLIIDENSDGKISIDELKDFLQ